MYRMTSFLKYAATTCTIFSLVRRRSTFLSIAKSLNHSSLGLVYFCAERVLELCLEEFLNLDRIEYYGRSLRIVRFCVENINLIVFNVDEVYFIPLSIDLELKVSIAQEKDGDVVYIIMVNRFNDDN